MGIYDQTTGVPGGDDDVNLGIDFLSGASVAGDFEFGGPDGTGFTVLTENYEFSVTSGAEFGTLTSDGNTGVWSFESNGTASVGDTVEIQVTGSGEFTEATLGGTIPYSDTDTITLNFVCFTRGALIETDNGLTKIENLRVGDTVPTRGNGNQPVRWIGSRKVRATGENAPIVISKGALGNTRDMRVSPGHRMLITGWRAEALFGVSEVLVAAKDLINGDTIYRQEGGSVEYFHILFDQHEIITVDGAQSESFHPAQVGLDNLDISTREEVLNLFPELRENAHAFARPAHATLSVSESILLH